MSGTGKSTSILKSSVNCFLLYSLRNLFLKKSLDSFVLFAGEIAPKDVPSSLAACDVLVMPFPDLLHYRQNMSPLKMFEYMASGRPIIASDLPTVRDVLSEKTCIFCTPGDVQSLRDALEWVKANPEEAAARAAKAHELVKRHTWEERMKRILSTATLKA